MITRWRALRSVIVFLVSIILVLYVTSRLFILRSFENLEIQVLKSESARVNDALGERLAALSSKAGDWGTWTQAYDYVAGTNPDFATTEVTDATMSQLQINVIMIVNASGKTIYSRGYDLVQKKEIPFPDATNIQFVQILRGLTPDSKLTGVVLLADTPMLIAARPIVTNDGQGPANGLMVFGRYFDALELSQLAATTHLQVTAHRLDQPLANQELVSARAALTSENPNFIRPVSEQTITSYTLLNDINGNPALMFRVEESRDIYQEGWTTVNYFMISLSVIVSIFAAVALTLADRLIRSQQRARESEELYYALAEAAPDAIYVVGRDSRVKFANETASRDLTDNWQTILGEPHSPETLGNSDENIRQVLDSNEPLQIERRVKISKKETWLDIKMVPLPSENGHADAVLGIARDITERKQSEVQVQHQMRQLRALHAVDEAITSSADIALTLKRLLYHAVVEFDADAADVLLLEPGGQTFKCVASIGFHSDTNPRNSCTLQDTLAGGAVLERRTVLLPTLKEPESHVEGAHQLILEGIVQCAASPLIIKDHVRGVLEIFYRAPFELNQDRLDFFHALARQAAIAVDYSETSSQLVNSNRDLALAYDSTLGAWIRALDLREGETEGHSHQVAELTVRLACALGVADADLVQVRRGALLHDIGKIAIPDSILHNRGILTEAERAIMQKHPVTAYAILSPIPFLKDAIDIPYCHHEKWDGTGYPRGLAGEAIPLAARAFAIVDTWDALRSTRSYRAAWTAPRIEEYLCEQSGKQFDPRVVNAFQQMTKE